MLPGLPTTGDPPALLYPKLKAPAPGYLPETSGIHPKFRLLPPDAGGGGILTLRSCQVSPTGLEECLPRLAPVVSRAGREEAPSDSSPSLKRDDNPV